MRSLPPIPDADAQLFFVAALERWQEACLTLVDASVDQDGPRLHHAARQLGAGVDDLYRYVAALRRANGQAPDPGNPFN